MVLTSFKAESRQVGHGLFQTPDPDIGLFGGEAVDPEGVAEQPLGQPDARNPELLAETVAHGDKLRDTHNAMGKGEFPPSSRTKSLLGEITPRITMRPMITIDRERLRELIKERGTTPRAVSRAVGSNDTLIRDILSGRSRNARGDTMAKIAEHLGVAISQLMSGIDGPERSTPETLAELPLVGPVQAGAWLALDDTGQDEPVMWPAAHDRRYPRARQWLREVQGDSMTARNIFPGDLAHIVEVVGSGVSLNTGMIVEVTRSRDGGALREITLKEVEVAPGGLLLWPRSTNPRWNNQGPLRLDEGSDGDIEVEITGLLLAKITRF